MNNKSITMNEGTGPSSQNKEMQIWGLPNQLPRNGPVGIIKLHGQVTHLLFPISYLMEVVNSANGSITS